MFETAPTVQQQEQTTGCPPMEAFPPPMVVAEQHEDSLMDDDNGDDTTAVLATTTTPREAVVQAPQGEFCPIAATTTRNQPETSLAESNKEEEEQLLFAVGDHVYQWCRFLGIPGVFQHHGIVIHVENIPSSREEGANGQELEQLLTIADFSNLLLPTSSSRGTASAEEEDVDNDDMDFQTEHSKEFPPPATATTGSGSMPFLRSSSSSPSSPALPSKDGCLRVYKTISSSKDCQWHKVQYQDHWFHTHLWKRSGTCTPAASDPPELVLKRVYFLLSQSNITTTSSSGDDDESIIPKYHSIYANCECVAVWCKTGTWSTLQAASFLSHAAVGQVKGTATIAGIAAAQTVTVPATGVWGWLGYTSTVPLMSVSPLVLPAICAYGAVTVGGPAICLAVAKSKWSKTTQRLNQAFDAECLEVSLVT